MPGAKFEVLFYPEIDDRAELANLVQRAGWYLYPYRTRLGSITFVSPASAGLRGMTADPDMDPEALVRAKGLSGLFRFLESAPKTANKVHSFVFAWREPRTFVIRATASK